MGSRVIVLAVVVVSLAVASLAVNPECDPSYECAYTYVESDLSDKYTFDFSTLCSSTDYVLTDAAEHTYYANICGTAKQNCLPGKEPISLSVGMRGVHAAM